MSSDLSIKLEKKNYVPGDTVSGVLEIRLPKPVKTRSVVVSLLCNEWIDVGSGKHRNTRIENVHEEKKTFETNRELQSASYPFSFKLPSSAPPTIAPDGDITDYSASRQGIIVYSTRGRGSGISWKVHAKVDVPMGLDVNSYEYIFVY